MKRNHLDINPAVLAEAAEWFALLNSGSASEVEREQWQVWLAAHSDHRAAWSRVEFFTHKFNGLPSHAASAALGSPYLRRRQALKIMAVVATVGLSSRAFWRSAYCREWAADYRTGIGDMQTITLADGTQVTLDAASAIDVEFKFDLRRLHLLAGEIYIETAPDSVMHRPFVVDCAEGRVRALGTRFSIRQQQGNSQAMVFAGAVEITPAQTGSKRQTLQAGQEMRFNRQHTGLPHAIDSDRPAWTQGFLLADNLALSEFVLQLNRYRQGFITCAPEIAELRIVGSFPIKDTDRILAALEESLPVKVSKLTRWWVRIERRS